MSLPTESQIVNYIMIETIEGNIKWHPQKAIQIKKDLALIENELNSKYNLDKNRKKTLHSALLRYQKKLKDFNLNKFKDLSCYFIFDNKLYQAEFYFIEKYECRLKVSRLGFLTLKHIARYSRVGLKSWLESMQSKIFLDRIGIAQIIFETDDFSLQTLLYLLKDKKYICLP